MTGLAHDADHLGDRCRLFDRDDVGARHHDVVNPQLTELEQVGEHGALVRANRHFVVAVVFDELFKGVAQAFATIAPRPQAA